MSRPGQFQKGKSGNPGGRSKQVLELVQMARTHCDKAIIRASELLDATNADGQRDGKVVMAAAQFLRDTGMGRPAQVEFDLAQVSDDDLRTEILRRAELRKATEPQRTEGPALDA